MANQSALKAGAWYTVGNILIKGLSFLTVPIFTRLMLPEDYGIYNVFMSYVSFGYLIVCLAIHTSLKNAKYDFSEKFEKYASTCYFLIVLLSFVFLLLLSFFKVINVLSLSWIFVIFLILESFCQASTTYYNNYLSLSYRAKSYLIISLFYAVASISLSVLFIKNSLFENNANNRILGTVIPNMLISFYILIIFLKNRDIKNIKSYCKYGLAISLPLLPHAFSQIILSQFDRMMISKMDSFANAGIYSFATNISSILMVIATSTDTAWTPWFFENMDKKNYGIIKSRSNLYISFFMILTVGLLLISPELVILLADEKYRDSTVICMPLIISVFFTFIYYLPSGIEYFLKKTKFISIGTLSAAVMNIVLNYFTIKLFGFKAAAYTTAFCYMFYFIFHVVISRNLIGKKVFSEIFDLKFQIFSLVIAICFMFLAIIFVNFWIVRWGIMLVFCGFLTIFVLRKYLLIRKESNK